MIPSYTLQSRRSMWFLQLLHNGPSFNTSHSDAIQFVTGRGRSGALDYDSQCVTSHHLAGGDHQEPRSRARPSAVDGSAY
jgi:hypothetical protein